MSSLMDEIGRDVEEAPRLRVRVAQLEREVRSLRARNERLNDALYKSLREAYEDKCRSCKASWYGECVTEDGKDCEMVARWKSVLAKVEGEVSNG